MVPPTTVPTKLMVDLFAQLLAKAVKAAKTLHREGAEDLDAVNDLLSAYCVRIPAAHDNH